MSPGQLKAALPSRVPAGFTQGEGERKVKVKGSYPGKERPGRSGSECTGSEVVFPVNGRFQVEVRSSNVCDLPLFYKLIGSMNLAGLPR
ncbi:MAG: hypothetical protein HGB21_03125 [Nitrospirae bacterium]|nr:hypothetical protein [Nitrospirota bacterium]NTW65298.1 hypothetical protein [Nitrospirota bacterium]